MRVSNMMKTTLLAKEYNVCIVCITQRKAFLPES